jgi:hypothetical protein
VKFIFSDSLPAEFQGYYFNYANQDLKKAHYLNAKAFILKNQNALLADVEKWHSTLALVGIKKVKNWWITPASRLLSWSPPIYRPLLFAVAIKEILKDIQSDVVYVLNAPRELRDYLKEFFPGALTEERVLLPAPLSISFSKEHVRPYLGFLRNHLSGIKQKNKLPEKKSYKLLVFSQVLNAQNNMRPHDHFYGDALFSLDQKKSEDIFWLYYYPENHHDIKRKIFDVFKSRHISLSFTQDYLNLFDIFKIILKSLVHKFQMGHLANKIPVMKILGYESHSFLKDYDHAILSQGQSIIAELEVACAMKKITEKYSFEKIIYPYEEKSIERALIKFASPQTKTLGFVHAAMHQGHICFDLKSIPGANPPRPNEILVTGEAPKNWFMKKGYSSNAIHTLGSPRAEASFSAKTFPKKELKILIIISQPHELNALAEIIEENPSSVSHHHFTVRKYPYGGLDEQNKGFKRLAQVLSKLKDEGGNLAQQVAAHDVVLFSTSSGGIEAIFHGALGLYASLDEVFILNPLEVLQTQDVIPQAFSIQDLNFWLQKYASLDQQSFETLQKNQVKIASEIYQKTNVEYLFS